MTGFRFTANYSSEAVRGFQIFDRRQCGQHQGCGKGGVQNCGAAFTGFHHTEYGTAEDKQKLVYLHREMTTSHVLSGI